MTKLAMRMRRRPYNTLALPRECVIFISFSAVSLSVTCNFRYKFCIFFYNTYAKFEAEDLPRYRKEVWQLLFCGAGHEKMRGEQLKWSLAYRLYIGSFPCAQLLGPVHTARLSRVCYLCAYLA